MHIWLAKSSMVTVLWKANFSLQQRNKFNLTIMVVETLRRYNPTQSQIKVINNPTILIKSVEIHVNTQVLDTQIVHSRGHG